MPADEPAHAAYVDAWLAGVDPALPPDGLASLFEAALGSLWRRTEVTLGQVTLAAIVDRVLFNAAEKHPFVATITVGRAGPDFAAFREEAPRHPDLRVAMRVVLVEFLTVLGHLTDEIMTPALHAALSNAVPAAPSVTPGRAAKRGFR
jgi:hypothetical protein